MHPCDLARLFLRASFAPSVNRASTLAPWPVWKIKWEALQLPEGAQCEGCHCPCGRSRCERAARHCLGGAAFTVCIRQGLLLVALGSTHAEHAQAFSGPPASFFPRRAALTATGLCASQAMAPSLAFWRLGGCQLGGERLSQGHHSLTRKWSLSRPGSAQGLWVLLPHPCPAVFISEHLRGFQGWEMGIPICGCPTPRTLTLSRCSIEPSWARVPSAGVGDVGVAGSGGAPPGRQYRRTKC